ncbi:MAG: tRNA-dihydrouridine synthase [Candidatus Babeliales bacterium]|jgi:nifR3 family TIM-barrel protein
MDNKQFWQETFAIKDKRYHRFMSAPLDGITDSPMRRMIRIFSPSELLFTEMRHVACVANERDGASLRYDPVEQPLAFQFSANKTDFIDKSVEKVIEKGFGHINLNSGCPAPVVTKSGSGSALMGDVPRLETLIKHFIKAIDGRVPFTLKIRAGFKEKNALHVAQMAQECGVDCVIVHPRTQPEGFASRLDFDLVKKIKETLTIPVVFSGNISSFQAAEKTYNLTGVDGFMIGRALWGTPWKIREITDAAQGKEFVVDAAAMLNYTRMHLDLNAEFYGTYGFGMFKKQLGQYIRFIPNAAEWRQRLLRSKTEIEMRGVLEEMVYEYGKKD